MEKKRILDYLDIMTATTSDKVLSAFVAAIITEITGDLDGYVMDDEDYDSLGTVIELNKALMGTTNVPSAVLILSFIRKVEKLSGKFVEEDDLDDNFAEGPLS